MYNVSDIKFFLLFSRRLNAEMLYLHLYLYSYLYYTKVLLGYDIKYFF